MELYVSESSGFFIFPFAKNAESVLLYVEAVFLLSAFSIKSAQEHLFVSVETEILFCNIKNVAHKRATLGLIGAIYGGLYKKYRPKVNYSTPFLYCISWC